MSRPDAGAALTVAIDQCRARHLRLASAIGRQHRLYGEKIDKPRPASAGFGQ
ncbi:MAG: hypothetical protein KBA75_04205 [Alphaproteobacteria bacterium]|nr:hypothetical protein [Alphaproteobacteria bacterium]